MVVHILVHLLNLINLSCVIWDLFILVRWTKSIPIEAALSAVIFWLVLSKWFLKRAFFNVLALQNKNQFDEIKSKISIIKS